MRRAITSALSVTVVAATSLAVGAAPSTAEPTTVPIAQFSDMAVDEAHDTVLVTSGTASSDVTVLGLDGTPRSPIGDMGGARDVHLSADGSVFYLSLETDRAIGVVDAATLGAGAPGVTKIPLGADVCPSSVTEGDGTLWFTYTDCADDTGSLGSVRLSDETVTLSLEPDGVDPDLVVASPALPGRVVARTATSLVLLDVSAGATSAAVKDSEAIARAGDVVITPDGLEVFSVDRSTRRHVGYSTADMTERTVYRSDDPTGVAAVRGDGLVAASAGFSTEGISFFHAGSAELVRSKRLTQGQVVHNSLEFGETDVYVMTTDWTSYWLERYPPRRLTSMTMSRGRTIYDQGATARITVTMPQAGAMVRVYAAPYGGTKRLLTTAPTDANGTLTVTTPVRVRTKFTAYFDGDAEYDPTHAWISVAVRAKVTAKATKVVGHYGAYNLVKVRTAPRVYATVRPYHVGQCVRFQLQQYSSTWRTTQTTGCLRLNAYSKTYIWFDSSWRARDRVRVRVLWGGDTKNAKARSSWLYLRFVS